MRLIDADELKKELDEQMNFEENCRDSVFDIIDNAPTVAEVFKTGSATGLRLIERPHGEWVEKVETKQLGHGWLTTHEIVCSVCGGSGENDENIPQCWKFCPNCGADMRQEESE